MLTVSRGESEIYNRKAKARNSPCLKNVKEPAVGGDNH